MKKQDVPVEKFKLTKGQLAFQKEYGKLAKVGKMLSREAAKVAAKGRSLAEMLREVEGGMQQLLQNAPEDPTKELSGQP